MGNGEFKRVFEAGHATRRSEWASVIVYTFLLLLFLGIVGFLIVDNALIIDWGRTIFWWLLIAGVPLAVSLAVGYLWSRARCRFVLAFSETNVQAGRLGIRYEDVDQVSVRIRDPAAPEWSSTAIEITGHGRRICVRIGDSERVECAALLLQRCHNAIFVDELDDVHPPVAPTDKARVARVALARFRKMALGSTYAAIAYGALAACMLYALFFGERNWFLLTTSVAGVPLGVWQARVYFKKARLMQELLNHLEKQGGGKSES